jgi:SAM-dependent methyltransferase
VRCAGWPAGSSCGPGTAIPAGQPAQRTLAPAAAAAGRLELRPEVRVLDSGAGVGGPAAWLAAESGVRPVCAEPMAAAVRASRRLFGLRSVVAMGQQLPFADGSFDAAVCLGVLCTTSDKAGALGELRRVLGDGARLGLLVFVADGPLTSAAPEGNEFPSEAETRQLLAAAGFEVLEATDADLADSPEAWTRAADAVDAEVERRHGQEPAFQQAQENSGRVGRLLSDGSLRPWLAVATARNARDTSPN